MKLGRLALLAAAAAIAMAWPARNDRASAHAESVASLHELAAQETRQACSRFASLGIEPSRWAQDTHGNQYHVDPDRHVIRRVGSDGMVGIAAGQPGLRGSADGDSRSATFNRPTSVAFDARGALYIADTGNHTVRRLDLGSGQVSTVAGVPGTTGTDVGDQPGRPATLNTPLALVHHDGKLLIADSGNHAIRWLAQPGVVLPFAGVVGLAGDPESSAGRYVAHFRSPSALVVLPATPAGPARLLALDRGNCVVRQITETEVAVFARCIESCRTHDAAPEISALR